MKIQNKGQAQLFKNKYLEKLTKTHPLVIWALYTPIILYMFYYSTTTLQYSLLKIMVIFIGAILFWTLFEYLAHRFVFHWISEKRGIQRVAYILHGNHHHFPRDKQRLFMPLVPSLLISSTLLFLFNLIMGDSGFIFFAGFITGYLIYASMHYAIHAWAPPFRWMKPLWRNHHLHHYKKEELGFGVSSTLWDWVCGTRFNLEKEKEDPKKVKELLFEKNKIKKA